MKAVARCFLVAEALTVYGLMWAYAWPFAAGIAFVAVTAVALFFALAERVQS